MVSFNHGREIIDPEDMPGYVEGPLFEACFDCNQNGNCYFQKEENEEECEIVIDFEEKEGE